MVDWTLDRIDIEGFLSIRSASVKLNRLNALVGANGAGKSNFVRVFELLGRLVDGELGLFVGLNGGAGSLINDRAERIALRIRASNVEYDASLLQAADQKLIFGFEYAHVSSTGEAVHLDGGSSESGLRPLGYPLGPELGGVRVFHFHDTSVRSPIKQAIPTADNIALRNDGANLAAMLFDLARSSDKAKAVAYRRIVSAIQTVAPFFRDFVLVPEEQDRVRLRWRQVGSDGVFSADQMSDGTLRFICLTTLLLHPDLPALVVLDEPELGLHPFAIMQLAELLRQAATRSQVLFATQSVTLLGQFQLDDVIVVERRDGASQFLRPDRRALAEWLAEYSLGELWEKNLLGGRPNREGLDG
ncbi:MAG TPA: AAA family ATPase [Pseudonocardiaceae bacterium]|nr:AAA family ATPase [Pseudonocardiaceae bacterium]